MIYPKPTSVPEWLKVNPKIGETELLPKIKKNRVSDLSTIARYARDMARGAWVQGADMPLCFNKKGELVNGEQRIRAVIKSGVTIYFVVLRDLDDNAIANIDNGKPRNLQNWLQINGTPQSGHVSSCTRALWMIRNTCLELVKSTPGGLATQFDYIRCFLEEPEIVESVVWVQTMLKKTDIRLRVAVLATLRHVLLKTPNAKHVDEFLTQIITGQDMSDESGTRAYRRYIKAHCALDKRGRPSWLNTQADDYGAIVIAWNAWVSEEALTAEECVWTMFPRHLNGLKKDIAGRRTLSKSHTQVDGVFEGDIQDDGSVKGTFRGHRRKRA